MSTRHTVHDEVGGQRAVSTVVDDYSGPVLADPALNRILAGKDIDGLKQPTVRRY